MVVSSKCCCCFGEYLEKRLSDVNVLSSMHLISGVLMEEIVYLLKYS